MLNARSVFDRDLLTQVCEMHETEFGLAYDLARVPVEQRPPDDFYLFRDNGSEILAVAHLDTVVDHELRGTSYAQTEAGLVVHSGALDDRLGAYIILDMLPSLGIETDILLTVGEESARSTAAYFDPPKTYDWMIEFDRGGTDVVMYQYDDEDTRRMVRQCGARVGNGIFSDICYLEHLGVKGFNWGVGYQDYHSTRGYAFLEDTFRMVDRFQVFHMANFDVYMPHTPTAPGDEFAWLFEDEVEEMPDDWDEKDPFHWADPTSGLGRPILG